MSVLDALTLPTPQPDTERPPYPSNSGSPQVSQKRPPLRDRSRWEAGDLYPGVIFTIPDTAFRVAVCERGYQWILQRRDGKDRWTNLKYFARKGRLATVIRDLLGEDIFPTVETKIESLPI